MRCGTAKAPAQASTEEPPAVLARAHASDVPTALALQETLAQFLSMFGTFVQAGLIQSCLVALSGFESRADLLLLSIVYFDIILGMDWLLPHYTIIDCHAKIVMLAMPGVPRVEWRAYVRDVSVDTPLVDSIPVVRDFPDVFPADLLGMPPDRDIDFGIYMLPGTQPISIPPYHMAPPELHDKGFIGIA
ncbi:uncharacterized protein [Nicotiana sylvestris]|uniref:uncharacterized protein n=1 Tax=Nicotiana sylvestris TaxID=4096 RepID=UPI00388C82F1